MWIFRNSLVDSALLCCFSFILTSFVIAIARINGFELFFSRLKFQSESRESFQLHRGHGKRIKKSEKYVKFKISLQQKSIAFTFRWITFTNHNCKQCCFTPVLNEDFVIQKLQTLMSDDENTTPTHQPLNFIPKFTLSFENWITDSCVDSTFTSFRRGCERN